MKTCIAIFLATVFVIGCSVGTQAKTKSWAVQHGTVRNTHIVTFEVKGHEYILANKKWQDGGDSLLHSASCPCHNKDK